MRWMCAKKGNVPKSCLSSGARIQISKKNEESTSNQW